MSEGFDGFGFSSCYVRLCLLLKALNYTCFDLVYEFSNRCACLLWLPFRRDLAEYVIVFVSVVWVLLEIGCDVEMVDHLESSFEFIKFLVDIFCSGFLCEAKFQALMQDGIFVWCECYVREVVNVFWLLVCML